MLPWMTYFFKNSFYQNSCKEFGQKLHFSNDAFEKDHSMIETRRLKNVIFVQTILSFVLSRKIVKRL